MQVACAVCMATREGPEDLTGGGGGGLQLAVAMSQTHINTHCRNLLLVGVMQCTLSMLSHQRQGEWQ